MDIKDQLKNLADKIDAVKCSILTEEATKSAIIMPFIQMMGYDVFNPKEVVPEFTCDIGTKKGEKVDYAIFRDGKPVILIECKHINQNLEAHDDQLARYFHVSEAKFAILTNGIAYRFYTDLENSNKMDAKPFLDLNISDIRETHIEELRKFHKSNFDVEAILNSANDLKYKNALKHVISDEFLNPSDDFVRLFCRKVYEKNMTPKAVEYFNELLKKSIQSHISDKIKDVLKNALEKEKTDAVKNDQNTESLDEKDEIVTTAEELEGFMIVKAICRSKVDVSRIIYRDSVSHFSIMLDNMRKTFCRLHFNGKNKYITVIDKDSKSVRFDIGGLDDIFKYSNEILTAIDLQINAKSAPKTDSDQNATA